MFLIENIFLTKTTSLFIETQCEFLTWFEKANLYFPDVNNSETFRSCINFIGFLGLL